MASIISKQLFSAFLAAGSIFSNASAQLSERSVELGSKKYIESVKYNGSRLPVKQDFKVIAQKCLILGLQFNSIVARAQPLAFIGPYTGKYYRHPTKEVYAGESDVLLYVGQSDDLLFARGREKIGGIGNPTIQFHIAVELIEGRPSYIFENIQMIFGNSGSAANKGFFRVGQWAGSGSKRIYRKLDEVAARLNDCISG